MKYGLMFCLVITVRLTEPTGCTLNFLLLYNIACDIMILKNEVTPSNAGCHRNNVPREAAELTHVGNGA